MMFEFEYRGKMPDVKEYAEQYNALTGLLLKYCCAETGERNMMISPLSILLLLSVVSDTVAGKTRDEVMDLLGNPNAGNILREFQKAVSGYHEFAVSNAVIVREDIGPKINKSYIDLMRSRYDVWVLFHSDIIRIINKWAEINTNGMITDIAPEFLKDVLLCLVNVVAFESPWSDPYYDWNLDIHDFRNADGTKSAVIMMNGTEHEYVENEDFTGFLKPYKKDGFAFMALLPKKEDSDALEEGLGRANLIELCKTAKHCTVHTMMPVFKFDYSQDLSLLFKKLGVKELFTENADFSPVSYAPLKMESILHKTSIDVNQLGTRAAAATFAYAVYGSLPPVQFKEVNLDRPFAFAIVHEPTGIPVFSGVVRHLENDK